MTDITRLINDLNLRMHSAKNLGFDFLFLKLDDLDVIAGALETLQRANTTQGDHIEQLQETIHQLESRTVKVEADIVDADASNSNQPGMVVAVHIDAGDFVKVEGQVYEVEETDFDDHDVTLWFVGGETLKCAAGCQIEVVSAQKEE